MRISTIFLLAGIPFIVGADDPRTHLDSDALGKYCLSLQVAEDVRRETIRTAKDNYVKESAVVKEAYLKHLANEFDGAMEARDLAKANKVDAEIKALTAAKEIADQVFSVISTSPKKTYDAAIASSQEIYAESEAIAIQDYLKHLEESYNAAFTARNVSEANKFDAAIKMLTRAADSRRADKHVTMPMGVLVEHWATDLGCLSGVSVAPGGTFGTEPYVYQKDKNAISRIACRNVVTAFAVGFPADRHGKIIFDTGTAPSPFNSEMFVSAPLIEGGEDLIFRVTSNGIPSIFYKSTTLRSRTRSISQRLTKGIAFGRNPELAPRLFAIDTTSNCLLSIDPSATPSFCGTGIRSSFIDDDLVITSDSSFGENAYMTDQGGGRILRLAMTTSDPTKEHPRTSASDFARILAPMSISQGGGAFGDFLYVGTADGNVFRVNPKGEAEMFLKELSIPADADIRGIEIVNDRMWLATDAGSLLRVIPIP